MTPDLSGASVTGDGRSRRVEELQGAIRAAYLSLDAALRKEEASPPDTSGSTAICAILTPTHIVVSGQLNSRACVHCLLRAFAYAP